MNSFFVKRVNIHMFFLSLIIGIFLSIIQVIQNLSPYFFENQFFDSAYTKWLSIDPFNFSPIIFFMVLPLLSSIPCAISLKEDIDSGFLAQLMIHQNLSTILKKYMSFSFILGSIVVSIPLFINFFTYFLLLPNINPDNLINSNLLITTENTMFVDTYYSHPFIHAILSICFTALYGGLFATFTTINGLLIKNKFTVLTSAMILQILLLVLNTFIKLPKNISYVPSDFLRESASTSISFYATLIVTILIIIYIKIIYTYGGKKIVW